MCWHFVITVQSRVDLYAGAPSYIPVFWKVGFNEAAHNLVLLRNIRVPCAICVLEQKLSEVVAFVHLISLSFLIFFGIV